MRFARGSLIVCYGLFAIASQTLLFREFLTVFEGNDISVGVFFGTWFLWVGLGALAINRAGRIADALSRHTGLLLLCYLPAFVLELFLILHMRGLAGVESYGLLPIRTLLLWSLVVNAPVSIVTGVLFPLACRWFRAVDDFPVAYVYICEAVGSFVGALAVTVLLALGIGLVKVFLILAAILSSVVFLYYLTETCLAHSAQADERRARRASVACGMPALAAGLAFVFLLTGVDQPAMRYLQAFKWTRLLPRDALQGPFQTAQAEYLYGQYQGQWVFVREGGVCETVPDDAAAGQTAAIGLCQKPEAQDILVVGSGLGLCRQFLRLPQVQALDWCNPDGQFVERANQLLEPPWRIADERFHPFSGDVRALLARKNDYYDIVVVNLPGASSSVLNRYYTVEFCRLLKSAMSSDGVLMVSVPGGENVMGTELVNLGASTKATLGLVFSKLVLTPGDQTWFIAGDSDSLTGDPAILRDRFAGIKGSAGIFPPEALLSVYRPERAAAAMELYSRSDVPVDLLVNRDARPLTYLYSLLVVAKQAGAPLARLVQQLILAGPWVFFIPIAVFVLVWLLSTLGTPAGCGPSGFTASALAFSTGWVGIGISIVLMYLFQTRFGSLYLHIGIISCLFMLGLALGAAATRAVLGAGSRLRRLLFAVAAIQTLAVGGTAVLFTGVISWDPGRAVFAVAFVLCGLCCGGYFPIAAQRLALAGFGTGHAAGKLEMADHFGAAVGSLATSLLFVPLLGARMALFLLVAVVLANLPLWVLAARRRAAVPSAQASASGLQRAGYALFGVGLSIILCSNVIVASAARSRQALPQAEAAALAGQLKMERAEARREEPAGAFTYFELYGPQDEPAGWIFSSQDLAGEVSGFGGGVNLAIRIDPDGKLVSFHIVQSNETPSYLQLLRPWYDRLVGRVLFEAQPFRGIDTVTGATLSSKAVLTALETSARRFAVNVLGRDIPLVSDQAQTVKASPSRLAVPYLAGILALALLVSFWGGFWSRLLVLAVTLAVGGFLLNAQYSIEQVAAVLSLRLPAAGVTSAFLLVAGVPILVLFFGNIYCGYVCPFGALQELLGYVLPGKFKPKVPAETMRWGRFVKYIVLFVLVTAFFLSRDKMTLSAEPLISAFNLRFLQGISAAVVAVSLLAALFYERFWCRYVCPVGAFLSLLNRVAVRRRFLLAKRFGRCEFGLSAQDHLDCIYCDRCRYPGPAPKLYRREAAQPATPQRRWSFLVAVVVIGAIVPALSVKRLIEVAPVAVQAAPATISAAGQPRDVDERLVRRLIEQKKLSDKEAEFYRRVE